MNCSLSNSADSNVMSSSVNNNETRNSILQNASASLLDAFIDLRNEEDQPLRGNPEDREQILSVGQQAFDKLDQFDFLLICLISHDLVNFID